MNKLKTDHRELIEKFDRECYEKYSLLLNTSNTGNSLNSNPSGATPPPPVNNRHSICNVVSSTGNSQQPAASASNLKHYFSLFNDRSASNDLGNMSTGSNLDSSSLSAHAVTASPQQLHQQQQRQSKLFHMSSTTPGQFAMLSQSSTLKDLDSSSSSTLSLQSSASSTAAVANSNGNGQPQLLFYSPISGGGGQQQPPVTAAYHHHQVMDQQFVNRGATGNNSGSGSGSSNGSGSTPTNRRNSTAFN
jgi:hypothetical protein